MVDSAKRETYVGARRDGSLNKSMYNREGGPPKACSVEVDYDSVICHHLALYLQTGCGSNAGLC